MEHENVLIQNNISQLATALNEFMRLIQTNNPTKESSALRKNPSLSIIEHNVHNLPKPVEDNVDTEVVLESLKTGLVDLIDKTIQNVKADTGIEMATVLTAVLEILKYFFDVSPRYIVNNR